MVDIRFNDVDGADDSIDKEIEVGLDNLLFILALD